MDSKLRKCTMAITATQLGMQGSQACFSYQIGSTQLSRSPLQASALHGGMVPVTHSSCRSQGHVPCRPAANAVDKEGAADKPGPKVFAPAICWKRVTTDLKLSRQLIQKLDQEKGIVGNVITSVGKPEGEFSAALRTAELARTCHL